MQPGFDLLREVGGKDTEWGKNEKHKISTISSDFRLLSAAQPIIFVSLITLLGPREREIICPLACASFVPELKASSSREGEQN